MSDFRSLPCGAWPSPLTAELAAASSTLLGFAGASDGTLHWVEGRPSERGRSVLMARRPSGEIVDVVNTDEDVRSRVHEYGGMPWTAVGSRLVYPQFDDQRLRVRTSDGQTSILTPPGCRYADGQGAVDGHTLVCVREDHRDGGEPKNAIVLLDLDQLGDAGRVLFGESDFVAAPRLSADDRWLAFLAWDHPSMPWDQTRLMIGEMSDGLLTRTLIIAGGPDESVLEPQWGKDGGLYFLSDRSGWWNLYRWHDGLIDAMTTLDAEIGSPLWLLGMQSYALTDDGRALLRISHGTVDRLVLLDLASKSIVPMNLPFVAFEALGLLDEHTGFAVATPIDGPPALILLDLRSAHHQVVREAGSVPMPPQFISHARAITFPTLPGPGGEARMAHAWFYPPLHPDHDPAPDEKPPLLVMMHGGPTWSAGPAFALSVQFWTTRGFAVVDVNYGGSSGFGRAYRERLRGQWGVVDLQDAVAAVDWLSDAAWVDGQRVAMRGGSAGGFAVLCALAFTDRFAAGINYFGVADLHTLACETHKFESHYLDGLIGPLPAFSATYRARSPGHHMAACRGALITFQGTDDDAVPPQQSRDVVAAARAAGCPVAYIEFDGEGHGLRQGSNIVRALQSELVFLGRVFGYTPSGDLPSVEIDNEQALDAGRPSA